MTKQQALEAIEAWRPRLEHYRANPRPTTLLRLAGANPECGYCGGKGCIWYPR